MLVNQIRWQLDADVVVVGYGAAGAVAALTAHEGGARVIILEKQEAQIPMTTSFMSGGAIICPNDEGGARRYMEALTKVNEGLYWTEPEMIQVWARYAMENKKWFEGMGGVMEPFSHGGEHNVPGVEAIDIYRVQGLGPGMMRVLYDQVNRRGIRVIYQAPANRLFLNSKGEVVGVQVKEQTDEGRMINVQARRAVILATGGFEFDEEIKLQYLKVYPCWFTGSPANTGDGIRMALGAGAQLWHMNCVSARVVMKFPEIPVAFSPSFGGKAGTSPGSSALPNLGGMGWGAHHVNQTSAVAGYIIVDRYGKRYTNENFKGHSVYYELACYDSQRLFYPRVPSYWIFDQKRMEDGPLVQRKSGPAGPARLYKWSSDNSEELERGWIKRAETIQELALRLKMDPQTLTETVNHYNLYSRNGMDGDFGRQPVTLIPLATPPYYAAELWPGGPNTQGGPRRNSQAQVMRADGSPIPRLYSAGELGSIYGMLYPGAGGNLAECIAFGRIAGENSSRHPPL